MLDDLTLQRIDRIKQHIGLSSLDAEFRSRGSCTCPFCGRKGKGYVFDDQFYRCYSSKCGVSGDLVSIYRKMKGLEGKGSFFTALSELEQIAGLSAFSSSHNRRDELLGKAVDIYSSILWTREGKAALDYLKGRGFDEISLNLYQVGYAPSSTTLRSYGLTQSELSEVQLYDGPSDKEYYSNRIIFPIRDIYGKYVHLVGRWLGDVPKDENGDDKWLRYKDSKGNPGTKAYLAFEHLMPAFSSRANPFIVLTEGFPDALTLNQAGIPAVGILGLEGLCRQYNKFKDFHHIVVLADNDYFDENHPHYPLEYKSWRRLIPQLVELQLLLPQTRISWMMVPDSATTSKGLSYQCKDVNDWFRRSDLPDRELESIILGSCSNLVTSLIERWGPDLSRHITLLRLISATGYDVRVLERYIPPEWSPAVYAMNVFDS